MMDYSWMVKQAVKDRKELLRYGYHPEIIDRMDWKEVTTALKKYRNGGSDEREA